MSRIETIGRATLYLGDCLEVMRDLEPVDHIIGEKLSSAYRFAEGAAYQRRSLEMDPQYLPARTQLAQDLLRLG